MRKISVCVPKPIYKKLLKMKQNGKIQSYSKFIRNLLIETLIKGKGSRKQTKLRFKARKVQEIEISEVQEVTAPSEEQPKEERQDLDEMVSNVVTCYQESQGD